MMGKTHYAFGALFTAAGEPVINHAFNLGLSPEEMALGVAIGTVAGVLPDIDHPSSLITKGLLPGRKLFGGIGKPLGWLLSIPPRIIGVGARATMNHRGGTHSVLFMLMWTILAAPMYAALFAGVAFILSLICGALSEIILQPALGFSLGFNPATVVNWLITNLPSALPLVMCSVFLGYLAHLVSDSMTKVPVPWPWPFSKKRVFLLPKPFRITTDSVTENFLIRPVVSVLALFFIVVNIALPIGQSAFSGASQIVERQTQAPKPSKKPPKTKADTPKQTQNK